MPEKREIEELHLFMEKLATRASRLGYNNVIVLISEGGKDVFVQDTFVIGRRGELIAMCQEAATSMVLQKVAEDLAVMPGTPGEIGKAMKEQIKMEGVVARAINETLPHDPRVN